MVTWVNLVNLRLTQPHDPPVWSDVDRLGRRVRGESGHELHVPGDRRHEARARGEPELPHGEAEAARRGAEERGVPEREVRLRHAHRQRRESELLQLRELLRGGPGVLDRVGSVDARRKGWLMLRRRR